MEDFATYFTILSSNKKALIENFEKIEECLLQMANNYGLTRAPFLEKKKHDITLEILDVLKFQVDLKLAAENSLSKLRKKLDEFDEGCEPQRDFKLQIFSKAISENFQINRRSSNPFLPEIANVKAEISESDSETITDAGCSENLESDTGTVVDAQEQKEPVRNEGEGISVQQLQEALSTIVIKEEPVNSPVKKNDDNRTCNLEEKLKHKKIYTRQEAAENAIVKTPVPPLKLVVMPPQPVNSKPSPIKPIVHFEIENDKLLPEKFCTFRNVATPSLFYLCVDEELANELTNVMDHKFNGKNFIITKYKTKAKAKEAIGRFGAACFINSRTWFRVEIVDWLESNCIEQVEVLLLDTGRRSVVSFKFLRRLDKDLAAVPKLAVKCHLALLGPSKTEGSTTWPEESINYFHNYVDVNKDKKFKIIYAHLENDSYAVDLEAPDSDVTISEILIKKKLAYQLTSPDDLPLTEEELEFDNINELVAGYDAKDEARICPFARKGTCYKGPRCKLEHTKLSSDGITTDRGLSFIREFRNLTLPQVNTCIEILITGCINVCHFYAQIIDVRGSDGKFSKSFENLQNSMNSKDMVSTYETFKVFPAIGEILLVNHEDRWHRGRCIGPADVETSIEVFLVDCGYCLVKKLSDCRCMTEQLMHLPSQAIECVLENCIQKPDANENEVSEFFKGCMLLQNFQAQVVSSELPLAILLWDKQGLDFGEIIKEFGLGKHRTQGITTPANCLLRIA